MRQLRDLDLWPADLAPEGHPLRHAMAAPAASHRACLSGLPARTTPVRLPAPETAAADDALNHGAAAAASIAAMRLLVTGLKRHARTHVRPAPARAAGRSKVGRRAVDRTTQTRAGARCKPCAPTPSSISRSVSGSLAARLAEQPRRRSPWCSSARRWCFHHEPDGPHRPETDDGAGRLRPLQDPLRDPGCASATPGAPRPHRLADRRPRRTQQHAGAPDQWQARGTVGCGPAGAGSPRARSMDDTARALMTLSSGPSPASSTRRNAAEAPPSTTSPAALQARFARHDWKIEW